MKNKIQSPEKFTVRVYGILLDEYKGVLVADEFLNNRRFTKFPGGGLELGEGTHDCLIREWKEELSQSIEIIKHFYTTDFFQLSAFDLSKQVICIYYLVKAIDTPQVKISTLAFDFAEEKEGAASFRWIATKDFHPGLLTFEIDKYVGKLIIENCMGSCKAVHHQNEFC